ncbi:hypothetical protein Micbo1qcDRAFT_164937, partial [Microdochium bolleyi]
MVSCACVCVCVCSCCLGSFRRITTDECLLDASQSHRVGVLWCLLHFSLRVISQWSAIFWKNFLPHVRRAKTKRPAIPFAFFSCIVSNKNP